MSTLHAAIEQTDAASARFLLANGLARVEELNAEGVAPLAAAVKRQANAVLDVLLAHASIRDRRVLNGRDEFGYTPLHWGLLASARCARLAANRFAVVDLPLSVFFVVQCSCACDAERERVGRTCG